MTPVIKLLSIVVIASSCFSISAVAKKSTKLSFDKQQITVEQDITGKLLYLNDKNKDADLLIQNTDHFVYYPNIVTGGLDKAVQIIDPSTCAIL